MTKLKMLGTMKKIVALVMTVVVMLGTNMVNDYELVNAATQTEDHGFKIDENLFHVNWCETGRVYVKQTARSWDSDFDKGVTLGYVYVYAGFATTKKPVDGKYYQRVLVQAKMVPQTVSGSKQGMSQYLTVRVSNGDSMQNTYIEPASSTGSTSYSTTGSLGGGANLGVSKKGSELTLNGGADFTFGISASSSYVDNSLVVITNEDNCGFARWDYDYISSGKSKAQNAYLFGSSTQYGLFSWNMKKGSSIIYSGLTLIVNATFGGGNAATNDRAEEMWTDAHNLGSASKTIKIKYK